MAGGAAAAATLLRPVFGQRPGGFGGDPKQVAGRQLAEMKERLKLSPEQEEKLKPILEESMKKLMALREKHPPQEGEAQRQQMFAEFARIREETNQQIAKVLDAGQRKEYEKMEQERRARMGGGRKGGGPKGNQ